MLITAERTKMKLYYIHKNVKFKVIKMKWKMEFIKLLQNVYDKMLSHVCNQNFITYKLYIA